jgi:hypothetical protein
MFQKDYNRLMRSVDSDNPSEEAASDSTPPHPTARSTRSRNHISSHKLTELSQSKESEEEEDNGRSEANPNHIMPTVIIKSQQNLDNQEEEPAFDNPDFLI